MKRPLVLLALASLAMFAWIVGNEADEFSLIDLTILFVGMCLVLLVQSGAILLVERLFRARGAEDRGRLAGRMLAALFAASNAYAFAFVTLSASVVVQAALSLAWGAILFVVMQVRRFQSFALFMLSAYSIMFLGLYGYTRILMGQPYSVADMPRIPAERNVYLIGNESLQSPRAYRELYGVDSLPHVDFLSRRGFRVLDRSYSADVQTLPSFSRVLEFRRPLEESDIRRRLVFNSMNATFQTFRQSGYKIQFIYFSGYFGVDSDIVDHYHPAGAYFQCGFVPTAFFYGLCSGPVKGRINRYLFGKPYRLNRAIVIDRIRVAAQSDAPWLTIYHNSYLSHSAPSHSFQDREGVEAFRARIRSRLSQMPDEGMQRVVQAIQEEDPTAVIVLFGDHGAAMLRGADLDAPPAPLTSSDILEDRFGVMVAVYPRDFCSNRISEGSTTAYLVESITRCLRGDDSPTPAEVAKSRTVFWEGEPRDAARFALGRSPQ